MRAASRPVRKRLAGHFPDLEEHALGGLQNGEVHVGAGIGDDDLERGVRVGFVEEGGDVVFLARVEPAREADPAGSLDLALQRLELVRRAAAGEDRVAFRRELPRDRRADKVAGADNGAGSVGHGWASF